MHNATKFIVVIAVLGAGICAALPFRRMDNGSQPTVAKDTGNSEAPTLEEDDRESSDKGAARDAVACNLNGSSAGPLGHGIEDNDTDPPFTTSNGIPRQKHPPKIGGQPRQNDPFRDFAKATPPPDFSGKFQSSSDSRNSSFGDNATKRQEDSNDGGEDAGFSASRPSKSGLGRQKNSDTGKQGSKTPSADKHDAPVQSGKPNSQKKRPAKKSASKNGPSEPSPSKTPAAEESFALARGPHAKQSRDESGVGTQDEFSEFSVADEFARDASADHRPTRNWPEITPTEKKPKPDVAKGRMADRKPLKTEGDEQIRQGIGQTPQADDKAALDPQEPLAKEKPSRDDRNRFGDTGPNPSGNPSKVRTAETPNENNTEEFKSAFSKASADPEAGGTSGSAVSNRVGPHATSPATIPPAASMQAADSFRERGSPGSGYPDARSLDSRESRSVSSQPAVAGTAPQWRGSSASSDHQGWRVADRGLDVQSSEENIESQPSSTEQVRIASEDLGGTSRHEKHRVVDGDSLMGLAERYLGDRTRYVEIFQANRHVLASPDILPIGVELLVPDRTASTGPTPENSSSGNPEAADAQPTRAPTRERLVPIPTDAFPRLRR